MFYPQLVQTPDMMSALSIERCRDLIDKGVPALPHWTRLFGTIKRANSNGRMRCWSPASRAADRAGGLVDLFVRTRRVAKALLAPCLPFNRPYLNGGHASLCPPYDLVYAGGTPPTKIRRRSSAVRRTFQRLGIFRRRIPFAQFFMRKYSTTTMFFGGGPPSAYSSAATDQITPAILCDRFGGYRAIVSIPAASRTSSSE